MNFEKPGGELTFFSILWCLGGVVGLLWGIATGSMAFAGVSGVILAASAGLWLQSQAAKYVLLVWFCCMLAVVTVLLWIKGFSWHLLTRGMLAAYSAMILYRWDGTSAD